MRRSNDFEAKLARSNKFRSFVTVLALCSATALADPPKDAPIQGVPSDQFVLLTQESAIAVAKRVVSCEAERDRLRETAQIPVWIPIVVGVVALGAGVGLGVGIAKVAK